MKKVFTLLCILIATGIFAQRIIHQPLILRPTEVKMIPPSRTIYYVDTLFWATGDGSIPALYYVPDPFKQGHLAGYIAGTDQLLSSVSNGVDSGNLISEEAQIFANDKPIKIIGAKFCFGAKEFPSGDPNSKVIFRIYRNDGTYINANAEIAPGPGTLLSQVAIPLDSIVIFQSGIQTLYSGAQNVIFPSPVYVDSGFTIGICIDSLNYIDTLGMYTSLQIAKHPPDMSLLKYTVASGIGNGNFFNYADTLNGWGYDLDLAIFPIIDFSQFDTISASICMGSSYTFNNVAYSATGYYGDTVIEEGNTYLYDSLMILNLTVNPDTTVLLSGDTMLYARATNATSYEWIDCATQQPVSGETSSTFKPSQAGNYSLHITQDACSGTSSCYAALISGVKNLQQVQFNIRPNPAKDICSIYPGDAAHGTWTGALYNIQGQLIQNLFNRENMQPFAFNTGSLSQGIYLIKVSTEDGNTGVQKLVIEE